jgi:3-hydroxy-9,10-secoandrosta-1,3,5(10)-triene-9,17-dione monooxygenase
MGKKTMAAMHTVLQRDNKALPASELIARARALVPVLTARAPQAERDRAVSKETIADLQAAGLFQALQPQRWGGHELGLDVVNDIQMTLAEGCMSTAWIYAVLAVEPFLIALCDERMAHDVWSDDVKTLASGTSAGGPDNKVIAVDGGFRVSGRWRFASGSGHAAWTFLGNCFVAAPEGPPVSWRLLLPRSDYKIVDTWNVSGLKATGSYDIVVDDAFVPSYRGIKQLDLYNCRGPGQAINSGPLYRIPFGQVFAMSVSTPLIGGLQGMLDAFLAYGSKRVARGIGPTAMDPVAQLVCAETATVIDELKTMFSRNSQRLTDYANRGEVPPLRERMAYKFQVSYAVERASLLANRLFRASGASGIYVEHSPFGRMLADINAGRQHVNNQFEPAGRNWGRVMLGGDESENKDMFL